MSVRNRIATATVVLMALSQPMSAWALTTDSTTTKSDGGKHQIEDGINHSGTGSALEVRGQNTEVNVTGDIKSENGKGVDASDTGKVSVLGDVNSKSISVDAWGDAEVIIDGNAENSGTTQNVTAGKNAKVTITGNVNSANGEAIRADDDAHVTVGVDLYGGNNGIAAWGDGSSDGDNIEINVGGDAYGKNSVADAVDGAIIVIEGDASGCRYGASASNYSNSDDKTSVTIRGDLDITTIKKIGDLQYGGVMGYNGGEVTVEGTIRIDDQATEGGWAADAINGGKVKVGAIDTSAAGVSSFGGSVIIEKSVESGDGYYAVALWKENSSVLIGEDLKTKDDGQVDMRLVEGGENSRITIGGKIHNEGGMMMMVNVDSEGNVTKLPEIVIGEITNPEDITIKNSAWEEVSDSAKKQVLENIKYIVNSNSNSMDGHGSFTITKLNGDTLSRDSADRYDVTTTKEQILVKIAISDGYELGSFSAGKNSSYVRNEDGSYTVTVADGGGVNIEALIRAIEAKPDPTEPIKPEPEPEKPTPSTSGGGSGDAGRDASGGTTGSWIGDRTTASGVFRKTNGTMARNEWADIYNDGSFDRYHFDDSGNRTTGWFTDTNGAKYYFSPSEGAHYGKMCTGWQLIDGKWYYFMPYTIIQDGMSLFMGTMLMNTIVPDGYYVGSDGAWIQ